MSKLTLYDMVHQVIEDSRTQLAMSKTAAAAEGEPSEEKEEGEAGVQKATPKNEEEAKKEAAIFSTELNKLADACDLIADNIHLVDDARSPHEKLAEYAAIHDALIKSAEDIPMNPPLGSGIGPGGPSSAMQTMQADASGTSLDAGESGEATPGHQPPKVVQPSEKPNPADAATALATNKEMMMADQPEDVLKQAEAEYVLGALVQSGKVAPEIAQDVMQKVGNHPAVDISAVPASLHAAFFKGAAEGTNVSIAGGTAPDLQSIPGVLSSLSQGSEAGELTPRQTAPTTGEGAGRLLVATNEAAIAATKGQAKAQNRGALAEVLTEPALSAARDTVLHTQLQNTPKAGVKLAAHKALLKKLAESSPQMRLKIQALVKQAQGDALTPQEEASVAPGSSVTPEEALAAQVLAEEMECDTPGEKIRSKGKGSGLARGRGRGPMGVPLGQTNEEGPEKQSQMPGAAAAPPPPPPAPMGSAMPSTM